MPTDFDKELLNHIQTNLPLESRPFEVIAARLNVDEQTVIERLNQLKAQGYIRRIGPFFDSSKLGYISTLAAVKVQTGFLEQAAEKINSYPGVTHNYEREGEYNLWFTLTTLTQDEQNQILETIRFLPGVEGLISLPALKKYKVSVEFKMEKDK